MVGKWPRLQCLRSLFFYDFSISAEGQKLLAIAPSFEAPFQSDTVKNQVQLEGI